MLGVVVRDGAEETKDYATWMVGRGGGLAWGGRSRRGAVWSLNLVLCFSRTNMVIGWSFTEAVAPVFG